MGSLISLEYFKPLKLNWIEVDVIMTKDGKPIIFHDKKLDRVSNFQGEVNKLTYNQLKSVDIGYKYALTFTGERIPLLSEFIEKCKKLSINIFLELKNYYNNELHFVNNVLEIIKDCDNIKIIPCSYSRKIIKYINELYPNIQKSFIVDEIPNDWYDFVK